jgi:glycine cleavage system regulatory protein
MSAPNEKPVAADVYAGDIAALTPSTRTESSVFLFRVAADAEADVFARVASVFNIGNIAPQQVSLRQAAAGQVHISVAIELPSTTTADLIQRKLQQLTCTLSVDCVLPDSSEKVLP